MSARFAPLVYGTVVATHVAVLVALLALLASGRLAAVPDSATQPGDASLATPAPSCVAPFGTVTGVANYTYPLGAGHHSIGGGPGATHTVTPKAPNTPASPSHNATTIVVDVPAHSNCGEKNLDALNYVSLADVFPFAARLGCDPNNITGATCGDGSGRVFTGVKWQCVEYGRRFLLRTHQATFASIPGAKDIFPLRTFTKLSLHPPSTSISVSTSGAANAQGLRPCLCRAKDVPVTTLPNGEAGFNVRTGDVLIYSTQGPPGSDMQYGHIAAVVDVVPPTASDHRNALRTLPPQTSLLAYVHVAEENWASLPWAHVGYSRALPLLRNTSSGAVTVSDPPYWILGVKRV